MRKYRTKEQWQALLQEQQKSGQTIAVFCKANSIHPNFFYRKRKELKDNNRFVRISIPEKELSRVKIRIKNIIIEPEKDHDKNELVKIIRTVLEAVHADI